jgi:putative tricarboxylic transport membrane protein
VLSSEAIFYYFLILSSLLLMFNTLTFWGKGEYLGEKIGPGGWPMVLLIFIFLSSLVLVRDILNKKVLEEKINTKLSIYSQYSKIAYLCFSISLYNVLLEIFGFISTTPLLFFSTLVILNNNSKILVKVVYSLIITAFFVYVFGNIVGVPLPRGNIEVFRIMSRIFY